MVLHCSMINVVSFVSVASYVHDNLALDSVNSTKRSLGDGFPIEWNQAEHY